MLFRPGPLSICLDGFNIFVKFSKISELTITIFLEKGNRHRGSIRIFRVVKLFAFGVETQNPEKVNGEYEH